MQLVSIVIPTKNEEGNIGKLLTEIAASVSAPYETIVVDDSDNNLTIMRAAMLGAKTVKGQGKGLGQAIIDGIEASTGEIVVVMDADLSHNPHAIPELIKPILEQGCDMTIGSRYVKGGSSEEWTFVRKLISRVACLLALPVTRVRDATSGFFAFRKSLVEEAKLEPRSWKIMLELLVKANPTLVKEIPITFEKRVEGKSKLTSGQMISYVKHLGLLALHKYHKIIKFFVIAGVIYMLSAGLIYFFTEALHWWYMISVFVASAIGVSLRFLAEAKYVFGVTASPSEASYEWDAFYKGSFVQKWWKQSIAKTVWDWVPSSSSLLDLGCGSSPIITHYPNAIGIDVNKKKLEFIESKCPAITTKTASVDKSLPFMDRSFDYVLCIELLEHLSEPEKVVSEIARLLKRNGLAVIATPDYSKWLWHLAEKFTPYKEEHVARFSRKSLEAMCRKHNLVPVKHKYIATCDLCEMFRKEDNG